MQDFNYVHSNCFEVTFELSCCKFPQASELKKEWQKNKESLLSFTEAVHWGVKGLVTNKKGKPIQDANIIVQGINHNVTTTARGEYWRLLRPGTYKISAAAYGYVYTHTHLYYNRPHTLMWAWPQSGAPWPRPQALMSLIKTDVYV